MRVAVLSTDSVLRERIVRCIDRLCRQTGSIIDVQLFKKPERLIRQLTIIEYGYALVMLCPDDSKIMISCIKLLIERGFDCKLLCIGGTEEQHDELKALGICDYVYEKDVERKLLPMLGRIVSEKAERL